MPLSISAEPVAFRVDRDGVARVAGTRVTPDTVIRACKRSDSPGEIAAAYPSLKLADVYAVIAYYLRHEQDVESYPEERQRQIEAAHRLIESKLDRHEIRERIWDRQRKQRDPGR